MSSKFRPYQKEIDDAIYNELNKENRCIVKAFCGTGKSNIMAYGKAFQHHKLKVYVFPSLSLIDQFKNDYLNECKDVLMISSESTTDKDDISKFMKKISNKTICITYNSFHLLNEYKINMCIFDEAHHAIGETYQELIFNNTNIDKSCFFTATPKTANGIDMLKDCGKIVYDYPYLRGVAEGYLNPFEIRVDLFGDNTINNIYDSIARAYYKTGNNRILTFHSDVNTESPTSVRNFVNKKEMTKSFKRVVKEFPTMKGPSIQMLGFYSELKLKERRDILKEFDTCEDVFILSSCETMGEGIDTKNANMCVFADAKTSFVKIIQNIGRVVRKQFGVDKPHSTILLPIYINKTKYEECKTAEECDAVIREEMKKGQDFTPILNVMSALKQEDEDLYDICLYYPNNYSPKEMEHNFKAQGYTIGQEQELEEIFDDDLEEVAERDNIQIDIHTDSLEEPIISYGESERVVSILQTEDKYCKIEGEEKAIKPPKRIRLDVHTNTDIQVLWKIENIDLGSCLLDCEVNDNWEERLEELREFVEREKRKPNYIIKTEKSLWYYLCDQCKHYKKHKFKNKPNKCVKWEEFIETYKEYFKSLDETWDENFNKLKQFMNDKKRRPRKDFTQKIKEKLSIIEIAEEKILGVWLSTQLENYKNKKNGLKNNKERCNIWENFLEEYKKYFKSLDEIWNEQFEELTQYITKYKKIPIHTTKLGSWLCTQKKSYKKKEDGFKNNSERCKKWKNFLEKYNEYVKTDIDIWNDNLEELKQFIIDKKRRPNKRKENETKLGVWLTGQITNYKTKTQGFKDNPERCNQWEEFLEEFGAYFNSLDELWNDNLEELKQFINKEKKRPSQSIKEEKTLSCWLTAQISNYKNGFNDNSEKCNQWETFLKKYKEYIKSDDDIWNERFEEITHFIIKEKRKPSQIINEENPLCNWLCKQISNYKTKTGGFKDNLKRCTQWENFIIEYKEYFNSFDEIWNEHFEKLKQFMNKEKKRPTDKTNKTLSCWLQNQLLNYKTKTNSFKDNEERYNQWSIFIEDYKEYFNSFDEIWSYNLQLVKDFMNKHKIKPKENINEKEENALSKFITTNKKKYKMKTEWVNDNPERCKQWEDFLEEYKEYLNPKKSMTLKPTKEPTESTEQKRQRIKTEISELHQKYKTLTSANLSKLFKNKTKWEHYHTISEKNEESFPKESIPRNQIITELDKIKTKRPKKIVDMGCGKANISKHFTGDKRFEFTNYDHVSNDDSVEECDISQVPLEDDSAEICILSLAMWGSNCKEYIAEAHRILETNGTLYIIEPTKRWTNVEPADRLRELLSGFIIKKETIEKFTMFIAVKI